MQSNKNVAILYLCIGEYDIFWNKFYQSFEKNFLPSCNKYYFVFTDSNKIDFAVNKNISKIFQYNLGWPYVSMLRWHMFLRIEKQLQDFDCIFFVNANAICNLTVYEKEILPSKNKDLVFAAHPSFYNKPRQCFEYERNPKSLAYIPYNEGKVYVQGCLFGGKPNAFLDLCKRCKHNTDLDISNNVLAVWYDESHLNKYVSSINNYKLLSPEYIYPESFENFSNFRNLKKRILMLDKRKVLDLLKIKGVVY